MMLKLNTPEAKAKAAATRAKNKLIKKPSRAKQLGIYLKYMSMTEADILPITSSCKKEGNTKRFLVAEIQNICTDCVGDNYDGRASDLIRKCKINSCPLHCVRPT